jgi:hypothetical protein
VNGAPSGVDIQRVWKPAPESAGRAGRSFLRMRPVENDPLAEEENLEGNLKIELMATLYKSESGLPANLYLDDSGSWSKFGDWRILKLQTNAGDRSTRDMAPMSIEDNPRVLVKNAKVSLNAKQLNQIKAFVRANKSLLLQLADKKIDFDKFCGIMVKV